MSVPETVVLVAEPGSPAPGMVVGGLTILERRLLEAQHRGVKRAIVACDGPPPRRPLTIAVERVAVGSVIPAGAEVVRADELAGVRVETRADVRRAERLLLKGLPKSFQGPIDALINCHFSLRITRVLARTPLTPNHVTLFAIAIGLAAAGLLFWGGALPLAVAGVLMFFQSVFDSCDGELARLRFQFSKLGQWLDNIADDLVDGTLIVALGFAAGGELWPVLGIAGGLGRIFTQLALYWQVSRAGGDFWNFRWWFETEAASLEEVYDKTSITTWLRATGRRDFYVFLWAVLCVANLPWAAAAYGVGLSAGYAVLTLVHLAAVSRRSPRGAES